MANFLMWAVLSYSDFSDLDFTCNSCIFSCNSGFQDEESSSSFSEYLADLFLRFPVKATFINTGLTATAAAAAKSEMAAKGATSKAKGLIPPKMWKKII